MLTRRSLFRSVLGAFAGCVLARMPLVGPSVAVSAPLAFKIIQELDCEYDWLLCFGGPWDGQKRGIDPRATEVRVAVPSCEQLRVGDPVWWSRVSAHGDWAPLGEARVSVPEDCDLSIGLAQGVQQDDLAYMPPVGLCKDEYYYRHIKVANGRCEHILVHESIAGPIIGFDWNLAPGHGQGAPAC